MFGTGSASTVAYTIGDDGSGKPTLAIGTVSAASGITATVDAPMAKSGKSASAPAASPSLSTASSSTS